MKISPHFLLQEFIYPDLYNQYKEKSIYFIDNRIIEVAEYIRVNLASPVTINNYHTGGQYKESGLRDFNTSTGGSKSQHKFGRAIDVKVQGKTPSEVFEFIKLKWIDLKALGLTTVENIAFTKTWNHLDCRYTGIESLLIVNP